MQKLQLSIPEPCHENWQNMTPTDQGRFCNACAKEVVDFSTMTDIQVLNYFTNLTHEKVCGRALPEQLDRTISKPEQPKKKLFWYWNYVVMFFLFFTKGNNAAAQTCTKPPTETSPVKNPDVRGEVVTVGKIKQAYSRIITGKVIDKNTNPVPFASIKIKGTNSGTIADANGAYSIKANSNTILVITGAAFKDTEVPVRNQSFINTVMERSGIDIKEVVVTIAGGIRRWPIREESKIIKANPVIIFKVREDNADLVIENAVITITKNNEIKSDTASNEKKGIYQFNKINEGGSYLIKVEAPNYQPNEFTIDASDFKDGKKEWIVLLKKQITQSVRSTNVGKTASQNIIRMGAVNGFIAKEPLYVVDGNIMPNGTTVNPDDIDHMEVLQGPAAAALFGPEGASGAIVITTRKAKEIKLKEVVVNSEFGTRRVMMGGMTGGMTFVNQDSLLGEKITTIKTMLTDSIKVYPNPVNRNSDFSVQLKLKQPGNNYSILITDASGKILLQQKFNASAKEHTEKIMGDRRWAAGIYYIRVFDTQNKLISKSSFIFQ